MAKLREKIKESREERQKRLEKKAAKFYPKKKLDELKKSKEKEVPAAREKPKD